MYERRNSIANALSLRLSCTNLSICYIWIKTISPQPPLHNQAVAAMICWITLTHRGLVIEPETMRMILNGGMFSGFKVIIWTFLPNNQHWRIFLHIFRDDCKVIHIYLQHLGRLTIILKLKYIDSNVAETHVISERPDNSEYKSRGSSRRLIGYWIGPWMFSSPQQIRCQDQGL